jgi:simple sugar transport system ATP-binding protein
MSLALENISKSFGAVQVLQDISLRLEPGQVTAIVGDNGAGKSTLLKLMAGIHAPDGGRISLGETELTKRPAAEHRKRGIEMVYQDLALAKQQDVVANLWLGRELARTWFGFLNRKAMVKKAVTELERLGIRIPDLGRPVGLLSGGQQQAVAIARAVLFDPKVLLLDEPTAALAAREVEQVLGLIRKEKRQNRVVVLVSHRLNDVFAVADRIVVMKQGHIRSDTPTGATTLSQVVENIVG